MSAIANILVKLLPGFLADLHGKAREAAYAVLALIVALCLADYWWAGWLAHQTGVHWFTTHRVNMTIVMALFVLIAPTLLVALKNLNVNGVNLGVIEQEFLQHPDQFERDAQAALELFKGTPAAPAIGDLESFMDGKVVPLIKAEAQPELTPPPEPAVASGPVAGSGPAALPAGLPDTGVAPPAVAPAAEVPGV